MRKVKHSRFLTLIAVFLVVLLLPTLNLLQTNAQGSQPVQPEFGINYLSTHYHFDPCYLNDTELERDLGAIFKEQGINFIIVPAIWSYLEPQMGIYNYTAFANLKHVCEEAAKFDIKVIIDFHTLMDLESFTMPVWLSPRHFNTVFTDPVARQAWLDFLGNFTDYVKDVSNIDSFLMMNEPFRNIGSVEWACNVTIPDFVNLWTEMKDRIRFAGSDKPVSIKFSEDGFRAHFNYDPSIYELCDYITLNYYDGVGTMTPENLSASVREIQAHNKTVMIGEFGLQTNDTAEQESYFTSNIDLFRSLGVIRIAAWAWRADYDSGGPETGWTLPDTSTYNLASDIFGNPKPAFKQLINPLVATLSNSGSLTTQLGQTIQFKIAASGGTCSYAYKWYVNGVQAAETSSALSFNSTQYGNFEVYAIVDDTQSEVVSPVTSNHLTAMVVTPTPTASPFPTFVPTVTTNPTTVTFNPTPKATTTPSPTCRIEEQTPIPSKLPITTPTSSQHPSTYQGLPLIVIAAVVIGIILAAIGIPMIVMKKELKQAQPKLFCRESAI